MLNSAKKSSDIELRIKNKIRKYGAITIAEYMLLISYGRSGYYENHKIGDDFITSSQISKGFGGLIAIWFYQIWCKYYFSREVCLVELGAGNGELMSQMLKILSQIPEFFDKISIKLVENSESLSAIQKRKLSQFIEKIEWVNDIGLLKVDKTTFFFSNEFFDCLPIHQFAYQNDTLYEILIKLNDETEGFEFCLSEKLSNAYLLINQFYLKNGNIIEISPSSINICKYINSILKEFSGISLIIDYGYKEFTGQSSLQGICNHKVSNIFYKIGDVDISAHVNFQDLSLQMKDCVTKIYSQKEFLSNLKIDKIADIDKYIYDDSDFQSMGELFKVMYNRAV